MTHRPTRRWRGGSATLGVALLCATTAHGQVRRPALPAPAANADAAADYDERRAAAGRLLVVSRFRARQAVLIKDAIRAAESEMTEDCLNRAATGRNMKPCEALVSPSASTRARLAASESAILDDVMAASQTIYAKRFTATEMDEIARFFRTPVGQRYAATYPQLLTEIQSRKREIVRRYLSAAASADTKGSHR
ncbi:DUF2059 domain-containing protein [Sphingomonas sp. UYP23]